MVMSIEDDINLVCRLHGDDIKAFDALYKKYHQAIYRNIYKLTKDYDVAQDILQDVFVVLWEKRLQIKPDQSVSGWLFVLSFNRSISYLRQKLKDSAIINKLPFMETEQITDEKEVIDGQYYLLHDAVNHLSPQKKSVFTLCKLEGRTYEEAAEKLNISKHTVKEYLGLAVVSVKNHINEHQAEWKSVIVLLLCYWVNW
jgi:RNA polymerase sigma-70 factor (ECF subfamily)